MYYVIEALGNAMQNLIMLVIFSGLQSFDKLNTSRIEAITSLT